MYKHIAGRRDRKWKIVLTDYGLQFSSDYQSDCIVCYNNYKWACDFPERLPKYVKDTMYRLLAKYGDEALNRPAVFITFENAADEA